MRYVSRCRSQNLVPNRGRDDISRTRRAAASVGDISVDAPAGLVRSKHRACCLPIIRGTCLFLHIYPLVRSNRTSCAGLVIEQHGAVRVRRFWTHDTRTSVKTRRRDVWIGLTSGLYTRVYGKAARTLTDRDTGLWKTIGRT